MSPDVEKYLRKRGESVKRPFESADGVRFPDSVRFAVVIPAYAEFESLPATLESLRASFAAADTALSRNSAVVVVVNNPPPSGDSAASAGTAENQKTLEALRNSRFSCQSPASGFFHLAWVDASSPGLEIPPKGGVGMARRIGFDALLSRMDWEERPVFCSLDADTLVEENYVAETAAWFDERPESPGASVRVFHQKGDTPEREAAIREYERHMNSYVEGLRFADSPYAYHFIGSAMVFRAESYVKAGGVPAKPAGEDFYFMQALRKTVPKLGEVIGCVEKTVVHPSPRFSDRVPFGTGRRLEAIIDSANASDGMTLGCEAYSPDDFISLRGVLKAVGTVLVHNGVDAFLSALSAVSAEFFENRGLRGIWPKIVANTPSSPERVEWAFHTWFDALKTFQFVRRGM